MVIAGLRHLVMVRIEKLDWIGITLVELSGLISYLYLRGLELLCKQVIVIDNQSIILV